MNTYVIKYGGTSVENTDKIKQIANDIVKRKDIGENIVVVVSAMGKTTNELIVLANKISKNPSPREIDMLLSTGEQVSISLLSIAIRDLGYKCVSLTGVQAGIETDETHRRARISKINAEKIDNLLNKGNIVVIAGFQGVSPSGEITTLGRGGSDTTAVSLAAVLEAPCEIYTDVDGVYTVDPKLYPYAKKLDKISYEEMLEFASRGAKVLETRAVEMAHKYHVPLYVKKSSSNSTGTLIKEMDEDMERKLITGMTIDEDCLMVSLNLVPFEGKNISNIFSKLANENIYIDMISQTAPYNGFVNVSFTTREDEKFKVRQIISNLLEEFPTIDYIMESSVVKLSVVGIGMISQSGVASALFETLSNNNIEFYQVTTSEISISYTINEYDKEKVIKLFAKKFSL
ncbi:aspartate kinase [Helicovermis profundi]|uniref:Aspartokinase n=1 Tax=Helicovermis profundi TaxID=3065157 RepID=A0AAU9E9P2_9FIRM|nr:aspartate kinase [Clostridia bacterium S502]